MHNRKKSDKPLSEKEQLALQTKCNVYGQLVQIIFERKINKVLTLETLELCEKLIKHNPDFYTLWNFRKEILLSLHPELSSDVKPCNLVAQIVEKELGLSTEGIMKNPKSYGAWHHRKWIIERCQVNFDNELNLCTSFLKEDQRNFHCWNYRRFLVDHGQVPYQNEIEFSTTKIMENFSNYSAFHHRSVFIKMSDIPIDKIIPNELSIVENAVFTEPDDQSAWWYHQFLLKWTKLKILELKKDQMEQAVALSAWFLTVLIQQLDLMENLNEIEPNCTWVKKCLITLIDFILFYQAAIVLDEKIRKDTNVLMVTRTNCLQNLIQLDQNHINRYQYLLKLINP